MENLNKSDIVNLPEGYFGLSKTPPERMLYVIDSEGNKGKAMPTYYPFKVEPTPGVVGKWTSKVVSCEPYWDGGWLIQCNGLTSNITSRIIGWKEINE